MVKNGVCQESAVFQAVPGELVISRPVGPNAAYSLQLIIFTVETLLVL
jgi:hypothetical protein